MHRKERTRLFANGGIQSHENQETCRRYGVREEHTVILFRDLLQDPNVQRVGTNGQGIGKRQQDPDHLVGVQCKLKLGRSKLTATEVETRSRRPEVFSATERVAQYHYKRPPRKRKPVVINVPEVVTVRDRKRSANRRAPENPEATPKPAANDRIASIVTSRPKRGRFGDVEDMTPEEHQRRGDAAEALFRELVRKATE